MTMTKKALSVILAVLTLVSSFAIVALAANDDKFTKEDAMATVLAELGIEDESKLDYLYIDHEEDFKTQKYPVWEIKFGYNNTVYEYYVSTETGEILPRYTSAKVKGNFAYMFLTFFYKFVAEFLSQFTIFDK